MKKKWVLRHCDLDLWPKVTNFNRVRASAISNHLAKTASKSVHPFGWNFVHKKIRTHRQKDRKTHTQTTCSKNITPPRVCGGVTKMQDIYMSIHLFIIWSIILPEAACFDWWIQNFSILNIFFSHSLKNFKCLNSNVAQIDTKLLNIQLDAQNFFSFLKAFDINTHYKQMVLLFNNCF